MMFNLRGCVIIFVISTSINSMKTLNVSSDELASKYHSRLQLSESYPLNQKKKMITKRGVSTSSSSSPDKSISSFITQRTCWWNEPCKKEFQRIFRCKCPDWAYCRSPGKYFAAHCSASSTGYIWDQNIHEKDNDEPDANILLSKPLKNNLKGNVISSKIDGIHSGSLQKNVGHRSRQRSGQRRGRKVAKVSKASKDDSENIFSKNISK